MPLESSIYNNDLESFKNELDRSGVNINQISEPYSAPPLHIACMKGKLKFVVLLLGHKEIDIYSVDKYDKTPFYHTCWSGLRIKKELKQASDESIKREMQSRLNEHIQIIESLLAYEQRLHQQGLYSDKFLLLINQQDAKISLLDLLQEDFPKEFQAIVKKLSLEVPGVDLQPKQSPVVVPVVKVVTETTEKKPKDSSETAKAHLRKITSPTVTSGLAFFHSEKSENIPARSSSKNEPGFFGFIKSLLGGRITEVAEERKPLLERPSNTDTEERAAFLKKTN